MNEFNNETNLQNQVILLLRYLQDPVSWVKKNRMGAGDEWRLTSSDLCDKNVPLRLKDKFYKVIVRSSMLNEAECWPNKNSHV